MRAALGPVDYAKPDGDVAQIAMIRFQATGAKIGSLVINPGGPGESGIEAAISMVDVVADAGPRAVRLRRIRSAWGWARRPRHCGATPTPTTTGCAPTPRSTTRPKVSRTSRTRRRTFVQRCVDKMGNDFLANVGTANVAKDLDAIRAAIGDDKLTYLGYSYGTRIGAAYAEEFPQNVRAMILDGAVDPNADPIEADLRPGRRLPDRRSTTSPPTAPNRSDCPLGTDPAKAVDGLPRNGRPAGRQAGQDQGSARAVLQRRDRRHHHGAVLAEPVAAPDRRALTELKDGRGDTMLALADMYMGRDADGPLQQRDRRARRGQLRRPAGDHRPRQGGRGGPPHPRGRAVHELRRVHRLRADAHLRVLAGAADQQPHQI